MSEKEAGTGNTPDNVVEKIEKVAGRDVTVKYDKSDTEFNYPVEVVEPTDLQGADLDKFKKDATNELAMKRSSSDKYAAAAEKERQLQKDKEEFEQVKSNWEKNHKEKKETTATPIKVESPNFNKILSEKLGIEVKSKADIAEALRDEPDVYHEAMMEFTQRQSESLANSFKNYRDTETLTRTEQMLLKQKAEGAGINFSKFKSYAETRGFPINEHALNAFKRANNITSLTDDINKSIPKSTEIRWTPAGDVKKDTTAKTLEEEFPTQMELEKHITKERRKPLEKQDPRVVEIFKD